jgi:hypothetical protein
MEDSTLIALVWQAIYAVDVQEDAAAQAKEAGLANVSCATRALAALGKAGACPQNVERDLERLLAANCKLPVVQPSIVLVLAWGLQSFM